MTAIACRSCFCSSPLAVGHEAADESAALAVHLVLKEIGIGLAVGMGLTFTGQGP
jgi:hypothetical protein